MNTLIKRAMIAAGITTAMALPLAGQASDGTVNFSGAVTASTCTVNVNGSGSNTATVTLPTVDAASLETAGKGAGKTSAGTFFNIALTGCAPQSDIGGTNAPTSVQIYFEAGPNVDEATGALINTTTTGSNVEVMLFNASGNAVVGTQINPGTATQPPTLDPTAGGTQWYYAGYSATGLATGATITAGVVTTSVTFSLVYQ